MAGADRQPALAGAVGDEPLVLGGVDRERAAHGERGAARLRQAVERRVDVRDVEAARRVEEGVLGVQHAAGRELEVADLRALAREPQLGLDADADHADTGDVALEQRVHRLRRGVGDELDAVAVVLEVVEQRAQRRGDALAHAARGGVRRRHDGVGAELERVDGERDGLRERAADVHADPDAARVAESVTPSRSRRPAPPARRLPREHVDRAERRRRRAAPPGRSSPCEVGWIPVSSARKTGSRGHDDRSRGEEVGGLERADGVADEGDRQQEQHAAPVISIGLSGSCLPSLRIA